MVRESIKKSQVIFECINCLYSSGRKNDYDKHLLTPKHKKNESLSIKISKKMTDNDNNTFYCKFCYYKCNSKCNYDKHLLTPKHKKNANISEKIFVCSCGKEYKFMGSLARHKNVCGNNLGNNILEILQDNKEFKEIMIEQNKQIIALTEKNMNQPVQHIQNNNIQNNHNTQNIQQNATFNLNYFLNTTCKDAINMKDFIESINVNFNDLENTGKNGFVKSMTQVITRELGKLEACMRPIHCSDVKRKVLHIKNENEWQKDTEQYVNTKKMVSSIAHKTNVLQIPLWVTANPRSEIYDDKLSDLYFKILGNSMDGSDETYEKIITGVSGKIHVGESKPQLLLLK